MSIYTDELQAEKAVNRSLITELKRRFPVSYLKLHDGTFVKTSEYEVVTEEVVREAIGKAKSEYDELNALLDHTATEDPTPAEPEAPEVPAQPETPASIEVNGEQVPANADGTISIDTTPEPAPALPTPPAPTPDTTTPSETTPTPAPVVLQ